MVVIELSYDDVIDTQSDTYLGYSADELMDYSMVDDQPQTGYGLEPSFSLDLSDVKETTIADIEQMTTIEPIKHTERYLEAALETVEDELMAYGFDVSTPDITYNPVGPYQDPEDVPAAQYDSQDDAIRIRRSSITDQEYTLAGVLGHELMHKYFQQDAIDLWDTLEMHGLDDAINHQDGRYHLYGLLAENDETVQQQVKNHVQETIRTSDPMEIPKIGASLAEELESARKAHELPAVNLVGLEEGLCHTFTLVMEDRLNVADEAYWEQRAELYEGDYQVPGTEIAHFGEQTTEAVRERIDAGHDPMDAFARVVETYWDELEALV